MSCILVVDDDPGTVVGFAGVLRTSGFQVLTAESGLEALDRIDTDKPDGALVDLRLPDMSGIDVVRLAHQRDATLALVVVTGFASTETAVDAIRCGAVDYIEKPVFGDDLVTVVQGSLARIRSAQPQVSEPITFHAADRWAKTLIPVVQAVTDVRTVAQWSRSAGMSEGALKARCAALGVSPKRSLALARLVRASLLCGLRHLSPSETLDIVDRRTITKLLTQAGIPSGDPADLPGETSQLLDQQTLIRNQYAIDALRRLLAQTAERG